MLLLCAKPHDILDASAIVPAAVKQDDLTSGREMLHIALHVHLGLLPLRGCRQGHDAEDTGAHPFGDRLDRPALTGGVAPFEDDDNPQPLVFHPVLELAEFRLKPLQFLFVCLALQLGCTVVVWFACHTRFASCVHCVLPRPGHADQGRPRTSCQGLWAVTGQPRV